MQLMDVTLRDGSYAVNFQFSCQDVKMIGNEMEESGIELIEIGHGMGLGASSEKNGIACNTDEEYLAAAQQTIKKAKYGMFCIPGIASLDDIDMAASYGMGFIRIGTNADAIENAQPYIERAKHHNMLVFANYMKSYTISPQEFAKKAKMSKEYGADAVYIVDSAGGMFQNEIRDYYEEIKSVSDIKVGYHGHNNLGLAVSNSIYAVELGMDYVDCSLQGLGRSAGNAALELVVACLKKKGWAYQYDCKRIVLAGKKLVQPLLRVKGVNPLDIYSGLSEFHSSYMQYIHKYASKYCVSPLDLIYEYCKYDKINLDENKLKEIAKNLPKENMVLGDFSFCDYIGNEQKNL